MNLRAVARHVVSQRFSTHLSLVMSHLGPLLRLKLGLCPRSRWHTSRGSGVSQFAGAGRDDARCDIS